MQNILIAIISVLAISFAILFIFYLRERAIRKLLQKDVKFFKNEKPSFISLQKKITSLEEEKATLKKKNSKYFLAEIRYTRIFRSQKRKIIFLSNKNEGLRHHLHNYDEIKIQREMQYKNLD